MVVSPGLRAAGTWQVLGVGGPHTPTHRSSSEPSKWPSPSGRPAASLPRLGAGGEPGAPSGATSSSSEPGGPSSELPGLGVWPRPAAAARMAASAAICARCIRALSGSLSSSGAALARAGGPAAGSGGGGGGCRASSSWRARCCRCRSVSITACSFMALRAGPPRAPGRGGGGGGGPWGEGARPHCSVGAAGEPGQCRVAGGRGGGRRAQAQGWRGMPAAGGRRLLLTQGTGGRRLAGGSFTCQQKPGGDRRDRQTTPGLLPTQVGPQRPLVKLFPSTPISVQTWGPPWRWRSTFVPSAPTLSTLQRAGKQGHPALDLRGPRVSPHPSAPQRNT